MSGSRQHYYYMIDYMKQLLSYRTIYYVLNSTMV